MLIFSRKNEEISKCFYDHHESVANCMEQFDEFFKALFSGKASEQELETLKAAVDRCEANADIGMREVISRMGAAFLPVTRKNLITLVQSTDEIANKCQEVARQIVLERIELPKELHKDILAIINITEAQLKELYVAIDQLLNDFKTIYKNRDILSRIEKTESEVDQIETALYRRLFSMNIPLYEKVYYKGVIEGVCDVSDIIEDIADQILVMLVEREA